MSWQDTEKFLIELCQCAYLIHSGRVTIRTRLQQLAPYAAAGEAQQISHMSFAIRSIVLSTWQEQESEEYETPTRHSPQLRGDFRTLCALRGAAVLINIHDYIISSINHDLLSLVIH